MQSKKTLGVTLSCAEVRLSRAIGLRVINRKGNSGLKIKLSCIKEISRFAIYHLVERSDPLSLACGPLPSLTRGVKCGNTNESVDVVVVL